MNAKDVSINGCHEIKMNIQKFAQSVKALTGINQEKNLNNR